MTSQRQMTVLVTGFGPFPGTPENASAILARRLVMKARRHWPHIELKSAVIPTEWRRGPQRLNKLAAKHQPRLNLHFGVSVRARGFVIETFAYNACRHEQDAAGVLPHGQKVVPTGPAQLPVRLPAKEIVRQLKSHGLPAALSSDAGGYLCNSILYHSLQIACEKPGLTSAGFVHVPASLGTIDSELTWEQALDGAMVILETCIEHVNGTALMTR